MAKPHQIYCCSISRIITLAFVTMALVSCSTKPEVQGIVLDGFGKPLPGATVTVHNTTFATTTDSAGRYAVEYVPGMIVVTQTKEGYTSHSLALNIATKAKYPAQNVTLYKIPADRGVFAFAGTGYTALQKGQVRSETPPVAWNAPPAAATYTVTGSFVAIQGGAELTFLDNQAGVPQIYGVGPGGVILKHQESWGQVVMHSAAIFPETVVPITPGFTLRKVTLPKGKFAFWEHFRTGEVAYLFEVK